MAASLLPIPFRVPPESIHVHPPVGWLLQVPSHVQLFRGSVDQVQVVRLLWIQVPIQIRRQVRC